MLEKEYSEDKTEKGNPQFKSGSGTIMLISDPFVQLVLALFCKFILWRVGALAG